MVNICPSNPIMAPLSATPLVDSITASSKLFHPCSEINEHLYESQINFKEQCVNNDSNNTSFFKLFHYSLTISQSEHIGQCDTPHHLSDVRRGAPS